MERVKKGVENKLWKQGIDSWDTFLEAKDIDGLSLARKKYYDRKIIEARHALYNFNSAYFKSLLPQSEYYRLYDFFKDNCVFLDIETTGLDFRRNDITVIGLFDGLETKTMIKGINLDYDGLKSELAKHKLIITFNGASFDIPKMEKYFSARIRIPHIDLRHVLSKIGHTGGLKKIEKDLGIQRPEEVLAFDGQAAVDAWKMWKATGDRRFLELLIKYNEEDVINLKPLAKMAVKELWKQTRE